MKKNKNKYNKKKSKNEKNFSSSNCVMSSFLSTPTPSFSNVFSSWMKEYNQKR